MNNFKYLLLMSIIPSFVMANDEWNFNIGTSVSIHPFARINDTAQLFENKLSKDGMVVTNNPTINLNKLSIDSSFYKKYSFIYSRDCMNSPISGFAYSFGKYYSNNFYIGLGLGAYVIDKKAWNHKNVAAGWVNVPKTKVFGYDKSLMPIIGGEVNFTLFRIKKLEINLNTYFNPALINSTISVGFSF
jgi:hypothetical protein